MKYGLPMGSHDRLPQAVTRRLSPTISDDDVYLALALDERDYEPRPRTRDETGKRIPRPSPDLENGMHHDLEFDKKVNLNPKYHSLAPEKELR